MARVDDYRESFRLASLALQGTDLALQASRAAAEIVESGSGEKELRFAFLDEAVGVRVGTGVDVFRIGDERELSLPEKIILCHYVLHASGKPPTGQLITFRQIPDGHFYYDAFQRRARDPFLSAFGRDAELFRVCAGKVGGEPVSSGDVGMIFRVLPTISIQLGLWLGDEEFTPDAAILFDANIEHQLPIEDVAVISGMLVYRLMGLARSMTS